MQPMRISFLFVAACSGNSVPGALDAAMPASDHAVPATDAALAAPAPIAIAVGDLNGDGRPDLAVANYGANTVSIFLDTTATGAATPTFAAEVALTTPAGPHSIAVGDLNGDGKLDVAVASLGSNAVSVFLNTTPLGAAPPSFAARADLSLVAFVESAVALADINGDGKLDVAVTSAAADTVAILVNTTGSGAAVPAFAAERDFPTGADPESIAVGDFNGDGVPDLAVATFYGQTISVLLDTSAAGATTASFAPKLDLPVSMIQYAPTSVAVGDLNGDGKPDLAVGNFTYAQNSPWGVSVWLDTTTPPAAAPTFAASADIASIGSQPTPSLGDVDGDGKLDLVIASYGFATVSVLINTTARGAPTTSFAASVDCATGTNPATVALADFNGDGKLDLAVANEGDGSVSLLLNTTAAGTHVLTFAAKVDFATGGAP